MNKDWKRRRLEEVAMSIELLLHGTIDNFLMVSRGEEGLRVPEDVVICVFDVGLNCFACFCIGKYIKFEAIP